MNTQMAKVAFDDELVEEAAGEWAIELWEMKLILDVSVIYEIK
jgi:hypothetical protein